jgi:hypothetical protein
VRTKTAAQRTFGKVVFGNIGAVCRVPIVGVRASEGVMVYKYWAAVSGSMARSQAYWNSRAVTGSPLDHFIPSRRAKV